MYYSVLWYSQNLLLEQYFERFLKKLSGIFSDIVFKNNDLKDDFYTLDMELQKNFLTHPDISSLLLAIHNKKSQDAFLKLWSELEFFVWGEKERCTMFSWKKIKGTDIYLSLDDNNPDNWHSGHPDHAKDSLLWWWEKTPEEWNNLFEKTFSLLKDINEEFYNELNVVIKKIVPMKTSKDVHNSCSYKDCVGTLYLWYTTNIDFPEIALLEAIIHESSHNKLNLIMQSESLTKNDFELKYYSPYRPDARHIYWVYLWVHAIVPTIFILLHAIESWYIDDEWWQKKIILYHIKNKLWYNVIKKYADLTPIGKQILDEIYSVMELSDSIIKKSIPLSRIDKTEISYRAKNHFIEVRNNYPYLQY